MPLYIGKNDIETVAGTTTDSMENPDALNVDLSLITELMYCGLFALICQETNKALVIHSFNCIRSLVTILSEIRTHVYSNKDFQLDFQTHHTKLRILEKFPENNKELSDKDKLQQLLIKKTLWMNRFLEDGYEVYNRKEGVQLIPAYKVIKKPDGSCIITVKLCNYLTVGEFTSVKESKDFVEKNYPKRRLITSLIYHTSI